MTISFLFQTTALASDGNSHAILLTNGGGYNDPSAPGFFEPRLQGATDTSSGIFVQGGVFGSGALGAGSATFGAVTLVNIDRGVATGLFNAS